MGVEINIKKIEQFVVEGQALQKKGDYPMAIRKYINALKRTPEVAVIPRARMFFLLGQAYYLFGDYSFAAASQQVSFSCMLEPDLLEDYKKLISGQLEAGKREKLMQFLYRPAIHLGHAMLDPKELKKTEPLAGVETAEELETNRKAIQLYRFVIEGHDKKEKREFRSFNSSNYEMRCVDAGFNILDVFFNDADKDFVGFQSRCLEISREIIEMPFKLSFS